jgi:hypothetical protein
VQQGVQRVFVPTFINDYPDRLGDKYYIARLVKEFGAGRVQRKSTERVGAGGGRVAGATRHGVVPNNTALGGATLGGATLDDSIGHLGDPLGGATQGDATLDDSHDSHVHLGDHVVALVLVKKQVTIVVAEIAALIGPNGAAAGSRGLTVDELADARTEARVRPLRSTSRGEVLEFDGTNSAAELKVRGRALLTITLRVVRNDGDVKLAADVPSLTDCTSLLWARNVDDTDSIATLAKLPDAAVHRGTNNVPLFSISASLVAAAPAGAQRSCPICSKNLANVDAALSHAAYHAIVLPNTLTHAEMCPLCYGPAADCPPFVFKTGSSLQPRILCATYAPGVTVSNLESAVKFQAASLAKSTAKNPSTNRPIVCPLCHPTLAEPAHTATQIKATKRKDTKRPAVWSYNMRAHWLRLHDSSAMPLGLARAIELDVSEVRMVSGNGR